MSDKTFTRVYFGVPSVVWIAVFSIGMTTTSVPWFMVVIAANALFLLSTVIIMIVKLLTED